MMLASSQPQTQQQQQQQTQQQQTQQTQQRTATGVADECSSSTSPTNTSASDASSMDMLASLMNAAAAAAAANAMSSGGGGAAVTPGIASAAATPTASSAAVAATIKTETSPLPTPPIFSPDAVTLLQFSQLFQAQQAVAAQFQRQQQVAQAAAVAQAHAAQQQHHQQQQQQQHQQQTTTQERKRSYPCTFQYCVICQKDVHSSKLPCHIRQCHVAKPMFQCPACDFTSTYSKNNVKSHMVSLHGLAGDPISYMDKYAGQVEEFMKLCFPNVRGRGRPMQGRTSPKSPISPTQRRGGGGPTLALPNGRRATMPNNLGNTADLLMAANLAAANAAAAAAAAAHHPHHPHHAQHQPQAPPQMRGPAPTLRFNPLQSIFPSLQHHHPANNNNNNNIVKTETSVNGGVLLLDPQNPSTSQPCKPGENEQPKYLDQTGVVEWSMMSELQTKATIFEETKTNMEIYIENIARKIETTPPSTTTLAFHLPDALRHQVELVRSRINLQLFEVMFAIHRMDTKVLDASLVDLLITVAPTACDTQLLRQKSAPHDANEEFLIGLTKIERIEEKLETMRHMGRFANSCALLRARIDAIGAACQTVRDNKSLRQVMQMIVAVLNVAFFADRTCCAVQGFSISEIDTVLNTPAPPASAHNVMHLLITILRDEINVDLDELFALVNVLEGMENEDFDKIGQDLAEIDDMTMRAEKEMENSGSNATLAQFIEFAKRTSRNTWELYNSVKSKITVLTIYLGNPVPRNSTNLDPRQLFHHLINFLRQLKIAIDSEASGSESDINILSP